jgi:hypothetical protein
VRHDETNNTRSADQSEDLAQSYERPEVTDYGTLTELTLGGVGPTVDLGLGGGGS